MGVGRKSQGTIGMSKAVIGAEPIDAQSVQPVAQSSVRQRLVEQPVRVDNVWCGHRDVPLQSAVGKVHSKDHAIRVTPLSAT